MAENHIVKVKYNPRGYCRTRSVFQYDYGQVLQFEHFNDLPDVFEIHFAKPNTDETITVLGQNNAAEIPDECLTGKSEEEAWLFLHDSESDGETKFTIVIPIERRKAITNTVPEERERNIISEAIVALNTAVDTTEAIKNTVIESETHVEAIETNVNEVYSAVSDIMEQVEEAANSASESKDSASESADRAEEYVNNISSVAETVQELSAQTREDAQNAYSYMQSALESKNQASVSQREAHSYMIETDEIKTAVTEIERQINITSSGVSEDAAIASNAVVQVQEAVEHAQESIVQISNLVDDARQAEDNARGFAQTAAVYSNRAENAATASESSSSRSTTSANNANRYASTSRGYAATSERFSVAAEAAKNETEEIIKTQGRAIAPVENTQAASKPYAAGSFFMYNNNLYRATTNISKDETIMSGINCQLTTVAEQLEIIYQLINNL